MRPHYIYYVVRESKSDLWKGIKVKFTNTISTPKMKYVMPGLNLDSLHQQSNIIICTYSINT